MVTQGTQDSQTKGLEEGASEYNNKDVDKSMSALLTILTNACI